jgi:hypothetical protein
MKKIYILLFISPSFLCSSQDILWEKSFGGKNAEYLFDVLPTADYGFILAGSSLSDKTGNKTQDNSGNYDYWIWKMDEHGTNEWQQNFGGSGIYLLKKIEKTRDGGYMLAGTSFSDEGFDKKEQSKGGSDYWIIKLNAKGGEEWQKTYGGSGHDDLVSILQTRDGGYILGGSSSSGIGYDKSDINIGNSDYWIIKVDNKGTIEWQKTFGGIYSEFLRSIQLTHDGGYIIGGYSNSPESGNKFAANNGEGGDYWILKLDTQGEVLWQQTIGGDKDDQLYAVLQTKDEGYLLAGSSNSDATNTKNKGNQSGTDFWVLKLDALATIIWQETYNFGKSDVLTSVTENEDGSFLISGHAQSEVLDLKKTDKEEINDYIALKISATGEPLWQKSVGSSGQDILKKVIETRDGGYLLAGTSDGKKSRDKNSGVGGADFWIVKLKDKDKKEQEKSNIEAIPNPTSTFTNVIIGYDFEWGLATVFDLGGRKIQSFKITSRTVPIDLTNVSHGVYLVKVDTNKGSGVVKVIKN